MPEAPIVFISYSHDNEQLKTWILELAEFLRENGVDVILDQWDVQLGADLPKFMEHGLNSSQRVLVICTDNYVAKANAGTGGVGYEKRIVTAELLKDQDQRRFIPIIKNVAGPRKMPTFMGAALYLDFSIGADEAIRRQELLRDLHDALPVKPPLGKNPFAENKPAVVAAIAEIKKPSIPSLRGVDSTVFFAERFAQTFPGARGIKWFNDKSDIKMRLAKLLEQPLIFSDGTPMWWWRGFRNMHIEHFDSLDAGIFLMNVDELNIHKIAAVQFDSGDRSFVYVETNAMEATGLYAEDEDRIAHSIKRQGFYDEEYGLHLNTQPVTRGEYDDGAALIAGNLVDIRGNVELRVRYTTPYNFLIASNGSPINNPTFDRQSEKLLNGLLSGDVRFGDLVKEIQKLPRRPTRY